MSDFRIQTHREVTQVTTIQDTALGIMKWGENNSFPQTLINLIEQSPCAKSAVSRTKKFYAGAGFEGEDEIVNNQGLTLKKVVSILAEDYAVFEAFAIHCNFNMLGQVTTINPMRIAELRFNEFDQLNYASKVGYHPNFGLNSEVRKLITQTVTRGNIRWIDRFNPKVVLDQIEALPNKLSDFQGQVLYHSESGHSSYPVSPLQAPINFLLSDIENSILVRKETATGFINSYILKTSLSHDDANLIAFEDAIIEAQGARGSGKIITFSGIAPEDIASTILEQIGSGAGGKTPIESAVTTFELDQKVINGVYLIPPMLAGADQKTGFSSTDLADAYFVFNAITQTGRDTIEAELNRILKNSVFDTKKIQINKLKLDVEEKSDEKTQTV